VTTPPPPPSFARKVNLTPPPPAHRFGHDRARALAKARQAERTLAQQLDVSFDAAAALAKFSTPSSKRAAPRPEAGVVDSPAPSASPAPPHAAIAPEPRNALAPSYSPLALKELWARLAELRDGLGPYEEEKLLATAQAFLAGQLPLAYWTRVLNALAETKRGTDAAYGARWR
jgi:hypothetical protein